MRPLFSQIITRGTLYLTRESDVYLAAVVAIITWHIVQRYYGIPHSSYSHILLRESHDRFWQIASSGMNTPRDVKVVNLFRNKRWNEVSLIRCTSLLRCALIKFVTFEIWGSGKDAREFSNFLFNTIGSEKTWLFSYFQTNLLDMSMNKQHSK